LASLREIKSRIAGIKSTEKITGAMKMVSAVKFRKAQENVLAARPYARKISEILKNLIPTVENLDNALLQQREIKKICIIVVTSDRGFVGSFNTNLIKAAQTQINEKYKEHYDNHNLTIITLGKKGFGYYSKREYDIYAKYTEAFNSLHFETAKELVEVVIKGYLEHKFDKVIVVYNEFKNAVQANITVEQFLPIVSIDVENTEKTKGDKKEEKHILSNFIYEPSVKEIIDYLLPKHLNTQIWRVMLESYASEQAARMTAMEIATTNANELVAMLQLNYNRARQAAITKEILEIVGGAEALRESS
jgi:F-type H+-transporting ATPase subunit gamma